MLYNLLSATALILALFSELGLALLTDSSSWASIPQPVIGLVSQPLYSGWTTDSRFNGYSTYIMAAYVQSIESAGARVVPLIMGEAWSVTLDKINRLDGIFFPGGSGDYKDFGKQIFDTVKILNDQGTFYPMWGTCLGF